MRAVSTVLDAALFLLLVSAAALTLAGPATPPQVADNDAGEAAGLLATTTAHVNYSLTPGPDGPPGMTDSASGPGFERTAHGTLAGLLGDAAVATVRVDGTRVTHTGDGFAAAVRAAVRDALGRPTLETQVVARWEPYPDAPVRGRVAVGPTPPPDAAVQAATLAVPSGAARSWRENVAPPPTSFDDLATGLAGTTLERLFPLDATRRALGRDHPVDTLVSHRYGRFAALLDEKLPGGVSRARLHGTTRRLEQALAAQYEADLRDRFETVREARESVAVETVHIAVRRWEP